MSFHLPIRRGEQHPLAKLTNAERRQCREERERGRTISDLAREFHVDRGTIRRIVHQPDDFLSP